jgi:putative oxidoreductase
VDFVQRLFSTFANGWAGRGLLFMRLVAGGSAFYCGISDPRESSKFAIILLSGGEFAGGILLIFGLWTPAAGILISAVLLASTSQHLVDVRARFLLAALGLGLAMIGPGAWSIDARLFGRKRIDFPN